MQQTGYILMAEDSANDVVLARRSFANHTISNELIIVCDGAEALDFLYRRGCHSNRPEKDPLFVILDVNMPRVNGIEVLTEIKTNPTLCHIPVVMLTSSHESPDVIECYRQRANAYVVKPFDFKQFGDVIETIGKFWVLNKPLAGSSSPIARMQTRSEDDDTKRREATTT